MAKGPGAAKRVGAAKGAGTRNKRKDNIKKNTCIIYIFSNQSTTDPLTGI